MEDSLIIGTTAENTVRIHTAGTTRLVEEARRIHQTRPTASAALGRVLTGTVIMGVMSDSLRRLTVEIHGDGVLINRDGSIRAAGGIIIQMMPSGADEATAAALEAKLEQIPALTRLLDEGMTPLELASEFESGATGLKVPDTLTLRYQCDCSRQRFRALCSVSAGRNFDPFSKRRERSRSAAISAIGSIIIPLRN